MRIERRSSEAAAERRRRRETEAGGGAHRIDILRSTCTTSSPARIGSPRPAWVVGVGINPNRGLLFNGNFTAAKAALKASHRASHVHCVYARTCVSCVCADTHVHSSSPWKQHPHPQPARPHFFRSHATAQGHFLVRIGDARKPRSKQPHLWTQKEKGTLAWKRKLLLQACSREQEHEPQKPLAMMSNGLKEAARHPSFYSCAGLYPSISLSR